MDELPCVACQRPLSECRTAETPFRSCCRTCAKNDGDTHWPGRPVVALAPGECAENPAPAEWNAAIEHGAANFSHAIDSSSLYEDDAGNAHVRCGTCGWDSTEAAPAVTGEDGSDA